MMIPEDSADNARIAWWLIPSIMGIGIVPIAVLLTFSNLGLTMMSSFLSGVAIVGFSLVCAWVATNLICRRYRNRKLTATQLEINRSDQAVWVCELDGRIALQNAAAIQWAGHICGSNINIVIAEFRADPEGARVKWSASAMQKGHVGIGVSDDCHLVLRPSADKQLLHWSLHRENQTKPSSTPIMEYPSKCEDFNIIPVALIRLSSDGHIIRVNAAATKLLHGILPEKPGSTIHLEEIFDWLGQPNENWLNEVVAGRLDKQIEMMRLRSPDMQENGAEERYVQIILSPTNSHPPGFIAALTDASELKTLEAQFVQSQKMQAIGQLAGGIAHDFNNLLTAIRGHSDLLMLRHERSDPDFADLDQTSQNTNRAAALVGQLLSFSRKQTLKLERLDLRDIMADLAHLLNRLVGGQASLQISHDPSLKAIRADRRLLEQVIMNLVVNARDAMPDGGEILLATENRVLDKSLIRDGNTIPAGSYVCITVTDTGCGISPEHLSKIFEPFFTTKAVGQGTGLGLSTAYGIVNQTGGYILCDSQPQKGACFSIFFPALTEDTSDQAEPSTSYPAVTAVSSSEQTITVLLVEDEASVRAVASRALRLKGYDVYEAEGGLEALSLLDDADLKPDIFVTDVVMPGMDGPTWIQKALDVRPATKVIFMSGYSEDVFTDGKLPVPHSVFLAKPFTLVELVQTVQQQVAEPAGLPEPS